MITDPIRVLLIEDDPDDVFLLKESLAEVSAVKVKLACADRLSNGLIQLAEQSYDVILLDLNLPDSRGLETLNSIIEEFPKIPVVVLSGLVDDFTTLEAVRQGAQDYLVKGDANGIMIAHVLRYAIERKRAEHEIWQKTEDLTLINTLNEAVNRGESFDVVLDVLAKETKRLFSCHGAAVYLLSSNERNLIMPQLTLPPLLVKEIEQLMGRPIPQIQIPLKDGSYFKNIIQNCEGKITSDTQDIQQHMLEFSEIVDLPAMARKAVQKCIPQIYKLLDIKSIITIPLVSNGKTIGLLDISSPHLFIDDDLKRIQNISGQITALILRKRAEEALQESEQRLRSLFETMAEGVTLVAPDGQIVQANHAAEQILGLRRSEIENRDYIDPAWEVVHPDETPMPQEEMAGPRAMKERRPVKNMEMGVKRPDGTLSWINVSTTPLMDQEGRLDGVVCTFGDITERKRAEERIRQEAARSAALLRAASQLNAQLTLEKVIDTVCNITAFTLDVPAAYVLLRNERDEMLYLAGSSGLPPEISSRIPNISRSIYDRPSPEVQPLVIPDVQEMEGLPWTELFRESGLRTYISVPMLHERKLLGTLNINTIGSVRSFTDDELALLKGLAEQTALAISNVRLYEDAQRRLRRAMALREIDMAIVDSFETKGTFDILLEKTISELGVDAADLLLLNENTQIFDFAAGKGFHTPAIQHTHLLFGQGYAGIAALERRIYIIPDLRNRQTDFLRSPHFASEFFVAYYAFPLIAKGNVKGVLEIYKRSPIDADQEWLDFLETLARLAALAIDNASLFADLQRSNLDLTLAYDATIEGWSHALDLRDKETEGHTQRVTEMTLRLARAMGVSETELVHVRRGALLHDIGKVGIPDHILLKPGPLTEEEWVLMRKHPVFAYEMLSSIAYLRPALDIPYFHHEKWDGTGYPLGLKGEQIPLAARIFALVDVWDALTSDRPYRRHWSKEKSLKYIHEQAGKYFDPKLVETFFRVTSQK